MTRAYPITDVEDFDIRLIPHPIAHDDALSQRWRVVGVDLSAHLYNEIVMRGCVNTQLLQAAANSRQCYTLAEAKIKLVNSMLEHQFDSDQRGCLRSWAYHVEHVTSTGVVTCLLT